MNYFDGNIVIRPVTLEWWSPTRPDQRGVGTAAADDIITHSYTLLLKPKMMETSIFLYCCSGYRFWNAKLVHCDILKCGVEIRNRARHGANLKRVSALAGPGTLLDRSGRNLSVDGVLLNALEHLWDDLEHPPHNPSQHQHLTSLPIGCPHTFGHSVSWLNL